MGGSHFEASSRCLAASPVNGEGRETEPGTAEVKIPTEDTEQTPLSHNGLENSSPRPGVLNCEERSYKCLLCYSAAD